MAALWLAVWRVLAINATFASAKGECSVSDAYAVGVAVGRRPVNSVGDDDRIPSEFLTQFPRGQDC